MSTWSVRSSASLGAARSPGVFSSMSTGAVPVRQAPPISSVTVNKSLLLPLNLEIDPAVHAVRSQEKEQIKTLNNRFASFIDKVRHLEQQNKMLETKWELLQGQRASASGVEPLLRSHIAELQRQLELISSDKQRLDAQNGAMHKHVDDYRDRYETEINRRNDAENQFVMLKKDVDSSYLSRVELDEKVTVISEEVRFFIALHDTELRELQESLKETSVVVQMENSRDLDMDQILSDVKAQYEVMAAQSRQEAELCYQNKFAQMHSEADRYGNQLSSSRADISELRRLIGRLQNQIQAATTQVSGLETQVCEAEQRGEAAVQDARRRLRDLELALRRAKQDLAKQLKDFQELMNVKLGLDIEISTYRKLLEGEEQRLGRESVVNVKAVPTKAPAQRPRRHSAVFIKTIETKSYS